MWKSQCYGKLFELPTALWIPLRGLHFPTFMFLFEDYLKSKVRKILDTTIFFDSNPNCIILVNMLIYYKR